MRLDNGQIEALDDNMAQILRKKTSAERIKIGFNLWLFARTMLISHLRSLHPDWSVETVEKEVAKRLSHGAV